MKIHYMMSLSVLAGLLTSVTCFAQSDLNTISKIQAGIAIIYEETVLLRDQQKYGTKCGSFLDEGSENLKYAQRMSQSLMLDGQLNAWDYKNTILALYQAKYAMFEAQTVAADCVNKELIQSPFNKLNLILHLVTDLY